MSSEQPAATISQSLPIDSQEAAQQAVDLIVSIMSDGLDHPELWGLVPAIILENPLVEAVVQERLAGETKAHARLRLRLLDGLVQAALGAPGVALDDLMPLCTTDSQNVQVQGVLFHIEGLLDPANPKYRLADKVCLKPFTKLDVLESSAHLCCASWLPTSVGNLLESSSAQVWNGDRAQAIRASMLDGSYRFCNKRTCPAIQSDQLPARSDLSSDTRWSEVLTSGCTEVLEGPEMVNLSYDRTCNLSCPSCRTKRYAADEETRRRFDEMQEREILPLLKDAKTVYVTGSGDPFASKNFRHLLQQLDPDNYPGLKFIVMTNGMLFTPKQWQEFPNLHRRVESLCISLDAATGATHERLRRGARWQTMERNLAFAGELLAGGLVDEFMITFTVQAENFREMGAAVDLAHRIGANRVYFGRITNWGTFSPTEYSSKAVFLPGHPEHQEFLAVCQDPRLRDPIVAPSDLDDFLT